MTVIFNKFQSVIAYRTMQFAVPLPEDTASAEKMAAYELEDDVLEDYYEFTLAAAIHYAMVEGAASELSSRMTAMDNATNNAGDMTNSLTLLFNRTRRP